MASFASSANMGGARKPPGPILQTLSAKKIISAGIIMGSGRNYLKITMGIKSVKNVTKI